MLFLLNARRPSCTRKGNDPTLRRPYYDFSVMQNFAYQECVDLTVRRLTQRHVTIGNIWRILRCGSFPTEARRTLRQPAAAPMPPDRSDDRHARSSAFDRGVQEKPFGAPRVELRAEGAMRSALRSVGAIPAPAARKPAPRPDVRTRVPMDILYVLYDPHPTDFPKRIANDRGRRRDKARSTGRLAPMARRYSTRTTSCPD